MPGGDGSGPMGMGPMTGRAAGYCAGFAAPGFMNPAGGFGRAGFGRGAGFGGGGRGWRNRFYATGIPGGMMPGYAPAWGGMAGPVAEPSREVQTQALKQQADFLEKSLAEVRERLSELEKAAQEA